MTGEKTMGAASNLRSATAVIQVPALAVDPERTASTVFTNVV
jgi:hypothetical protein